MEIRDKGLYDALKRYLIGVHDNSLDWRPHSPQFEDLLDFLSAQDCVVSTVYWWEPKVERREEISRMFSMKSMRDLRIFYIPKN